jgi:hypothetical protein
MRRLTILLFFLASPLWAANPTIRYFAVTGAGAADGTSHANRAALFSAGNWSTVLTGFNFTTDGMEARIETGSYSCSQSLASGLFTNAPTAANQLIFVGADSSGNVLAIPNAKWRSPDPLWDTSGMPIIDTGSNIAMTNLGNTVFHLMGFTASARTGGACINAGSYHWCYFSNSTANTAAIMIGGVTTINCWVQSTSTSYDCVSQAATAFNTRIQGNSSATTGNRNGFGANATTNIVSRMTIVNNPGNGVGITSANAAQLVLIKSSTIANNGGDGFKANSTASQTSVHIIENCIITGNVNGINGNSAAGRIFAADNHLRSNSGSNFTGMGNYPTDINNDTTSGTDADEYVDAANSTVTSRNFNIRGNSAMWGKGYGAADQLKPNGFFIQ